VDNWGGLLRHLATRRAIDGCESAGNGALSPAHSGAASDRPESAAIEGELADCLRVAIRAASDREASVFSLRYFGEMSNNEIATTLSISVDAAAVAPTQGAHQLKELLKVGVQ
jgi:DNA-directed RNA polymerase specialized sigma24 family protein